MKQTCPLPFGLSFLWAKGYSTYHPNEVTISPMSWDYSVCAPNNLTKWQNICLLLQLQFLGCHLCLKVSFHQKMVWRKDEQWQHHLEIWRKEALGMNLFLSCFNGSLLGLGKIILLVDLTFSSRWNDPSPILHYLPFLMKGANAKQVNLQCGFVGKKFANHQWLDLLSLIVQTFASQMVKLTWFDQLHIHLHLPLPPAP